MSTATKVLQYLGGYNLKPLSGGRYRCNSPLRAGSDSPSFALRIIDDEYGMWYDHVAEEGGSLYKLAQKLDIPLPEVIANHTTKRGYSSLKDYAEAHGISEDTLRAAQWTETTHSGRNALKFPTHGGERYRFLDGNTPHYMSVKNYKKCWYGLNANLLKRLSEGQPLVIANGEISTVTGQHFGLAAACVTSGEAEIPFNLINELKLQLGDLKPQILIVLDCDHKGRTTAKKIEKQLKDAGYDAKAVDLGLDLKADLADFCMLYQDEAPQAILTMKAVASELKKPRSKAWEVVPIDGLKNIPPPKYLIDPYLPEKQFTCIFGESGVGKSFVTLDMAMKIAEDKQVVYIAAEGMMGYRQRVEAWRQHHKQHKQKFHFIMGAVAIMDNQDLEDLYANLEVLEPELVVIDTMARSFVGHDENNAASVSIFTDRCEAIVRDFKCSVLVVHHTGKNGMYRGSSVLKASADMFIGLRRRDDVIQMVCDKAKNAPEFDPVEYKLLPKEVTLENPETGESEVIESAVIEYAANVQQTADDKLTKNQREILEALAVPIFKDSGMGRSEVAEATNIPLSSVSKALSSLMELGFISQDGSYQPYKITSQGREKLPKLPELPSTLTGIAKSEKPTPPKSQGNIGNIGNTNEVSLGEGLSPKNSENSLIGSPDDVDNPMPDVSLADEFEYLEREVNPDEMDDFEQLAASKGATLTETMLPNMPEPKQQTHYDGGL